MSDYSNMASIPILLFYLLIRYLNQPGPLEQANSVKAPHRTVQYYQNGHPIEGSLFLHCMYMLHLENHDHIDVKSITAAAEVRYTEMRQEKENMSVAETDAIIASESYLKDLWGHVAHLN